MTAFLVIIGVLAVFFLLVTFVDEQTKRAFLKLMKIRRVGVTFLFGFVAFALLFSGVITLQIIGGVMLLYALLLIMFDPTLAEIRDFLGKWPVLNRVFA